MLADRVRQFVAISEIGNFANTRRHALQAEFWPLDRNEIFSGKLGERKVLTQHGIQEGNDRYLLQSIRPENLTELGLFLQENLAGKVFVDLGFGNIRANATTRRLAQALGAQAYIGVDTKAKPETRIDEYPGLGNLPFTSSFVKNDLLSFVRNMPKSTNGVAFFISGMEPTDIESGEQYFRVIINQILRITQPGDLIIIGRATYGLYPDKDPRNPNLPSPFELQPLEGSNYKEGAGIRVYKRA